MAGIPLSNIISASNNLETPPPTTKPTNQTLANHHRTSRWYSFLLSNSTQRYRNMHTDTNTHTCMHTNTHLLPAAETTDHAVSKLHLMIFLAVMAHIAWVALATAWETQPTVALLVVLACAEIGQRLAFLNCWVFWNAFACGHHHLHRAFQT